MGNPRPGWSGKFPAKVIASDSGILVLKAVPEDTEYLTTLVGKMVTVDIELTPAVPPDGGGGLGDVPHSIGSDGPPPGPVFGG